MLITPLVDPCRTVTVPTNVHEMLYSFAIKISEVVDGYGCLKFKAARFSLRPAKSLGKLAWLFF